MFDKQKVYIEENKDSKMVRFAVAAGAFAVAYAGVYLLQHGLSPTLSDSSTLKATLNSATKNIPFLKDRSTN